MNELEQFKEYLSSYPNRLFIDKRKKGYGYTILRESGSIVCCLVTRKNMGLWGTPWPGPCGKSFDVLLNHKETVFFIGKPSAYLKAIGLTTKRKRNYQEEDLQTTMDIMNCDGASPSWIDERAQSDSMIIHTDGSCNYQDRMGGCAAILQGEYFQFSLAAHQDTTNNRMELEAFLLFECEGDVTIISDSKYCVNTFNEWMHRWVVKDFKGKKNVDLVKRLLAMKAKGSAVARWVRGHNGDLMNEYCDRLASLARSGVTYQSPVFATQDIMLSEIKLLLEQ